MLARVWGWRMLACFDFDDGLWIFCVLCLFGPYRIDLSFMTEDKTKQSHAPRACTEQLCMKSERCCSASIKHTPTEIESWAVVRCVEGFYSCSCEYRVE